MSDSNQRVALAAGQPEPDPASAPGASATDDTRRLRVLLGVLVSIAVVAALHLARPLLIPIALAFFFAMLLTGPVERLRRLRIPRAIASAVVMLAVLAAATLVVQSTISPAREWLERAPAVLRDVERKIRPLKRVAVQIDEVAAGAERVAAGANRGKGQGAPAPAQQRSLLLQTPAALISGAATFFLTFFFLAWGPSLLSKLGARDQSMRRSSALEIAQAVQHETSRYLGTIALINVGLGVATAGMTAAFGLPTPLLWGVVAATLNFIPYAGSAVTLLIVTIVALLTQDGLGPAVGVAASYLALATIEGQLVQPLAVGRRLSLSPLIVFIGLWVWGWLWGVAGMLLATPFLIAIKAASCQIPTLERVAEVLSPSSGNLALRAQVWKQRREEMLRASRNAAAGLATPGSPDSGLGNSGLANSGLANSGLANSGLANSGLEIVDRFPGTAGSPPDGPSRR